MQYQTLRAAVIERIQAGWSQQIAGRLKLANLTSLVERVSRFTVLSRNND